MLIGIDPHKTTHTAAAVEPGTRQEVASIRIEARLGEYRRMPDLGGAITRNADGRSRRTPTGPERHLTSWLLARGEDVVDVPSTAIARVRQLSGGGGGPNDRIDAGAACVAALQGDARPLEAECHAYALAILGERRVNLVQSPSCGQPAPRPAARFDRGWGPTDPSAATAAVLLWTVRPSEAVEQARKAVAKDLVTEIRSLDIQLKANARAIAGLVDPAGRTLPQTVGVGPIMAGRLISRTGRAGRFPSTSAFANYAGAAPVEVASVDKSRHRLPRHGDRQLNSALHIIAITQIRITNSPGHRYYKTKIEEGKTPREAARC